MTPDERQLLSGLFDRMQTQSNGQRDREAESFIADRVRQQPYAPYLLSQTVIVQEQALRAAADKIQQLESHLQGGGGQQPQEDNSFLGGIGRMFGGGSSQPRSAPPSSGGAWNQGQGYPQQGQNYPPQSQGGPWGQQAPQQGWGQQAPQQAGGGGFLRGALGAAAGVAGGVLAADALRGLFGGHNNPFGIAGGQPGGGETVVNNYYDGDNGGSGQDFASQDAQQDFLQDQSDDFAGNDSGDDSSFV